MFCHVFDATGSDVLEGHVGAFLYDVTGFVATNCTVLTILANPGGVQLPLRFHYHLVFSGLA